MTIRFSDDYLTLHICGEMEIPLKERREWKREKHQAMKAHPLWRRQYKMAERKHVEHVAETIGKDIDCRIEVCEAFNMSF